MSVLVNFLVAALAFVIARTVMAYLGADGLLGFLVAIILAIVVFLSDPAGWFSRR